MREDYESPWDNSFKGYEENQYNEPDSFYCAECDCEIDKDQGKYCENCKDGNGY